MACAPALSRLVGPAASALPLPQSGGRGSPTLPLSITLGTQSQNIPAPRLCHARFAWCTSRARGTRAPVPTSALLLAVLAASGAAPAPGTARCAPSRALTARAGTLVFETGLDVIADEPSYVTGLERNRWDGPLLRLVYSPADNVELDLEWVPRVGVWDEPGREVQSSYWGDVTLRAKWRIHAGRAGRPTLGARFAVALPQTEYEDEEFRPLGLGPNTTRVAIEALLSQPLGPLRLDVNAGLLLFEEVFRAHEQRDFLAYGVALALVRAVLACRSWPRWPAARATGCAEPTRARRPGSGCGSARGGCAATPRSGAASRRGRRAGASTLGPHLACARPGRSGARPAAGLLRLCPGEARPQAGGAGWTSEAGAAQSALRQLPRGDRRSATVTRTATTSSAASCSTKHKVVRGDRLRLVIADVGPAARGARAERAAWSSGSRPSSRTPAPASGSAPTGSASASPTRSTRWASGGAPIGMGLLWTSLAVAIFCGPAARGSRTGRSSPSAARSCGSASELDDARTEGQKLAAGAKDPRGGQRLRRSIELATARPATGSGRLPGASRPCGRSSRSSAGRRACSSTRLAPFLRRDQTEAASSIDSGSSQASCAAFWRKTRSASGRRSLSIGSSSCIRTDSISSEIAGIETSLCTSPSRTSRPVNENSPSIGLWNSWNTASSPASWR